MTAIEALLAQPAAQAIGWALVQFIWQGALIGAVSALALAALRHSAADVRYVVATIGLSLMLTVPVVTAAQAWRMTAGAEPPARAGSVPASMRHAEQVPPGVAAAPTGGRRDADAAPPARTVPSDPDPEWLPAVLLVWLGGVAVLTLRLLSGWLWIRRTRAHGILPAPAPLIEIAARLKRRLHIRRPVQYLQSAIVQVPMVMGWLKPVILMPAAALSALTPAQVEAILAHELAHIRRHDYLVNLLQTLVETLLFYHPAVWWLSRRIRVEREHCCDDLAVSLCGDPYMYASALADLEELRGGAGLALAATGGPLVRRVRRLIGAPNHAGRGPGWLAASVAVVLMAAMTAGALGARSAGVEQSAAAAPARASAPARPAQTAAAPARVQPAAPASRDALDARAADARTRAAEMVAAAEELRAAVAEPAASHEARAASMAQAAEAVSAAAVSVQDRADAMAAAATGLTSAVAQATPPSSRRHSGNFSWSDGMRRLEVKYDGDIEFTDDDRDVQSISPGGYLNIRETTPGGSHSIEIRADASGTLQRRYRVGGTERPFEPEGRAWLGEALPRFIRQTGIGARARVARFYRAGGVDAVLSEISRIEGSWARRVYYSALLDTEGLDARAIEAILSRVGRDIESDFELASLLIGAADRLLVNETARRLWFEAARTIGSDFETRRVLSAALRKGPVPTDVLAGVLDAASDIGSDFEAASLLLEVVKLQAIDDRSRPLFFKAVAGIGSAFERRRVLSALVESGQLNEHTLVGVLQSALEIGSDFEKASLLTGIAGRHSIETSARVPFFEVASSISSPFERGRVLRAVVDRAEASPETILGALRSVQTMRSGFETAQVLLAIASRHPLQGEARELYITAAERLGEHEQSRALAALVRSERR